MRPSPARARDREEAWDAGLRGVENGARGEPKLPSTPRSTSRNMFYRIVAVDPPAVVMLDALGIVVIGEGWA
jgi:hypothetical protein